jgi:DNA-binding response OmpR family regulator
VKSVFTDPSRRSRYDGRVAVRSSFPEARRPAGGAGRILLVEDEPRIRGIVRAYLAAAGYEVEEAADGRLALAAFDAAPPDLVVVDLLLPGLSGEALVRAIREVSDVPILIASAKRSDDERIEGLRLGADDYLPKPYNPVELVERVHAILRRTRPVSAAARPRSYAAGRLEVDPATRRFRADAREGRLTPTELRLLLALSASPGIVLDRERLLVLATSGIGETTRTIDVHVANLRRKLGDDASAPWAIETIPDAGYRWIATVDRESPPAPPRP